MEQENKQENRFEETMIEGRNAVLEAFRSGKTVDKLFVLDGCQDGPVKTITREAKKQNTIIHYVAKERLDQLSETGKHQGVIAQAAAYRYAEVEDMLKLAEEKNGGRPIKVVANLPYYITTPIIMGIIWVRSSVLPIWQAHMA
jgi:tRNA G18 (ribose-2'-O)-methylase SpoU